MLDTILVGAIVLAAAIFIGRRMYRQFTSKEVGCGCSGCGQSGCCSSGHSGNTGSCCSEPGDLR